MQTQPALGRQLHVAFYNACQNNSAGPVLQAGGSFIVLLETKGVAKSALKAEWGPPLRLYDIRGVADGNRPALVAQFESDKGWAIQQRALESLVPSLTVEDAMNELRK